MESDKSTIPHVSVCMVTYNHVAYIERAIKSVLAQQTNFPFELVIGEDYSNDGTREIVLEYAKRFPDLIRLTPHEQNVGALRNEALTEKICRGKYIAYCEGDDFWQRDDKLQLQYDTLEQDAELGLVYSDYDRLYPDSETIIKAFNAHSNNKPPKHISVEQIVKGGTHLYILTCTVMLRRSLLLEILESDNYLFNRKGTNIRDTSVWAEFAARSKVAYLDQSLASYTVNTESASKSKLRKKQLEFAREVSEIALHLARKYQFSKHTTETFERKWAQASIRLSIHAPEKGNARKAWAVIKKHGPTLPDYALYYSSIYPPIRYLAAAIDKAFRRPSP